MTNKNYDNYEKWNDHEIGKVGFINATKDSVAKEMFVNFILDNNIKSVLEVGPGELIEYQKLIAKRPIDYTIVDVSDVFLDNAKEKFPKILCIKSSMDELNYLAKTFELTYCDSVLEHSPNIHLTLRGMIKASKYFYFTMFKWKYSGDNGRIWRRKTTTGNPYWSTIYNIYSIIKTIELYGKIKIIQVYHAESQSLMSFDKYKESLNSDKSTRGDRLIIIGTQHE